MTHNNQIGPNEPNPNRPKLMAVTSLPITQAPHVSLRKSSSALSYATSYPAEPNRPYWSINPIGLQLIKTFEQFMPQAYLCPKGLLTIGYGHVIKPNEQYQGLALATAKLTEPAAANLLQQDLRTFELGVWRLFQNLLPPIITITPSPKQLNGQHLNWHGFSALVAFAFNCGLAALERSRLRQCCLRYEFTAAAAEFLRWNKIVKNGQVIVLAGLTARRLQESQLFLTP